MRGPNLSATATTRVPPTDGGRTAVPTDLCTFLTVPEAARLFHLAGDPTRLRLLGVLRDRGEVCVNELAGAVGLSQSAVSSHLMLLRIAGVVEPERRGNQVFYRLGSPFVAGLLERVAAR
jgi:ArsR family transcriptional regulator